MKEHKEKPDSEIMLYQTENGVIKLEVRLMNETVWLIQYQLEELFQTDRTSIAKHIKNIYDTGELDETATCAKIAQVQKEGNRKVTRNIALSEFGISAVLKGFSIRK